MRAGRVYRLGHGFPHLRRPCGHDYRTALTRTPRVGRSHPGCCRLRRGGRLLSEGALGFLESQCAFRKKAAPPAKTAAPRMRAAHPGSTRESSPVIVATRTTKMGKTMTESVNPAGAHLTGWIFLRGRHCGPPGLAARRSREDNGGRILERIPLQNNPPRIRDKVG